MQVINDVLSIPEKKGLFIGKPEQAFLDREDLTLKGFLVQLFGLPARLVLYSLVREEVRLKKSVIELNSISKARLISFKELPFFAEKNNLIPLKGLPIVSREEGFVGFLKNFKIKNKDSPYIKSIITLNEEFGIRDNGIVIEKIQGAFGLVIDEPYWGQESIETPFFDKKVIQLPFYSET